MDVTAYRAAVDEAKALYSAGKHGAALKVTNALLGIHPSSPELWTIRGRAIQLADGDEESDVALETARESLWTATRLAPSWTEPLLELAHFEFALNEQPAVALEHFARAAQLASSAYQESVVGEIRCLNDLGHKDQAGELLAELKRQFPDDEELRIFDLEAYDVS